MPSPPDVLPDDFQLPVFVNSDDVHARYSPSGSKQWLNCPGSVLGVIPDEVPSKWALEGTLAHHYAEQLANGMPLSDEEEAALTDEMREAVTVYVDYIEHLRATHDVIHEVMEERIISETILDFSGKLDCLMIYRDAETKTVWLHVIDYKHGRGVAVPAERNTQLICYLILALEAYPKNTRFRVSVVQPRTSGQPIDTVEVGMEEITGLREQILHAQKQDYLEAGEHCKWCPKRKAGCAAFNAMVMKASQLDFPELDDLQDDDQLVAEWCRILDAASVIKKALEMIPEWLLVRMKAGRTIPGWKAVKALGRTTYKFDEETTIKKLQRRGLGKKDSCEPKLRSPTQLEKAGHGKFLKNLTVRNEVGTRVVRDTDKRPAINFTTPEQDFEEPVSIDDIL